MRPLSSLALPYSSSIMRGASAGLASPLRTQAYMKKPGPLLYGPIYFSQSAAIN